MFLLTGVVVVGAGAALHEPRSVECRMARRAVKASVVTTELCYIPSLTEEEKSVLSSE